MLLVSCLVFGGWFLLFCCLLFGNCCSLCVVWWLVYVVCFLYVLFDVCRVDVCAFCSFGCFVFCLISVYCLFGV